jgi:hypothetical protein
MPKEIGTPPASRPLSERLADGGPRYRETPPDPYSSLAPPVAEPFNAATAALFVVIVAGWVWRLRGRYRQFPFLMACLPVLFAGGIGGTLYHALRTHLLYFLLDLIPIFLLALAGSLYLTIRLGRHYGLRRMLYALGGIILTTTFVTGVTRLIPGITETVKVNVSYAGLAFLVLGPIVLTLVRTQFRHFGYVWAGVSSFAIAWFCRLVDQEMMNPLPMGSHWLWHTFGAIATQLIIEYFYRVERDSRPVSGL